MDMGSLEFSDVWNGVTFYYPRQAEERDRYCRLSLSDGRVSKDIRVSYDFERDGWLIEGYLSREEGSCTVAVDEQGRDIEGDEDDVWKEVAFVPAWALHKEEVLTSGKG